MEKEKIEATFTFKNIDKAQLIALESLFSTMQSLGNVGSSRWVCFYSDGDGNFRPEILLNGEKVKHTTLIPAEKFWKGREYRIDYDWLYDSLRKEEEKGK